MSLSFLQPKHWKPTSGYSNGVLAEGKMVFIAGQIGWDSDQVFQSDSFIEQTRQALINTVDVLSEAGAKTTHITRMTWYITDKQEYRNNLKSLGAVYREVIGAHYPAMTLVQVADLLEDQAKVEIETTAVIPI